MKFNQVKNSPQQDERNKTELKTKKKQETQKHIIDYMVRFGHVGVYVMKNGKKGVFHEISTYVNDGEKPTSWALKVFHTDDWYVQFGINANVDFTKNDIFLSEIFSVFEEKYNNLEISGNRKMVLISGFDDRHQVEQVSNYIINMFKDIELDFADDEIQPEFSLNNSKKSLRIVGFYSDNKKDEESQKKFDRIVEKLSSIRLSSTDEKNFGIIKSKLDHNKMLKEKDKSVLDKLMNDYLSDHDRISIAMKFLRNEDDE